MLPIIPNCNAVIIRGQFIGREVYVLDFIGVLGCRKGKDWGNVEPFADVPIDVCEPKIRERSLMRIDGGSFETEQEPKEVVNEGIEK